MSPVERTRAGIRGLMALSAIVAAVVFLHTLGMDGGWAGGILSLLFGMFLSERGYKVKDIRYLVSRETETNR